MKKAESQEQWNKKRLFLALFAFLVLTGFFFELKWKMPSSLLGNSGSKSASVRDVSLRNRQNQDISSDFGVVVSQKIDSLRREADNINFDEIATSSPQIQKVISDLKNLQNLPRSQLKDACFNICRSL